MFKRWGLLTLLVFVTIQVQAKKSTCSNSYVPPHTREELEAVRKWAIGAAFNIYAKHSHFTWDQAAYVADVPNQALFNFGFATATSCLDLDVLQFYFGAEAHFVSLLRKLDGLNPVEARIQFSEAFLAIATAYGMEKYLQPSGEML